MFSKKHIGLVGQARGLSYLLLIAAPLCGQKFLPDDPVWRDQDDRNIPTPKRYKLSDYYDFIQNTLGSPGDRKPRTAMNINTLGEVPESSWYTNRYYGTRPDDPNDIFPHEHRLKFEDLAVQYGVAKPPAAYTAEWLRYDNANGRKTPMKVTLEVTGSPFEIPGEALTARPGQY